MKPKRIEDWSGLDDGWVAERKVDGHGGMVRFDEDGLAHFSNGQDVSEFLPTVRVPELAGTVLQVEYAAVRDGRKYSLSDDAHVMLSAGGLEKVDDPTIYVLGVLQYQDRDLRGQSWQERSRWRGRVALELDALIYEFRVTVPEVVERDEWDEVLPRWFEDGVEGVVFKHKLSTIKERGRSTHWLKFKPVHTVDAWCDGYKEGTGKFKGLVGSLKLTLFDGDEAVEIGRCSGMDDETRKELTRRLDAGEGFVVEAKYERWTLGGRLRFAQFLRVREDKTCEDCTMAEQGPNSSAKEAEVVTIGKVADEMKELAKAEAKKIAEESKSGGLGDGGPQWDLVKRVGGERWEQMKELAAEMGGEPELGGDPRCWRLSGVKGGSAPFVRCAQCRTITVLLDEEQTCDHPEADVVAPGGELPLGEAQEGAEALTCHMRKCSRPVAWEVTTMDNGEEVTGVYCDYHRKMLREDAIFKEELEVVEEKEI